MIIEGFAVFGEVEYRNNKIWSLLEGQKSNIFVERPLQSGETTEKHPSRLSYMGFDRKLFLKDANEVIEGRMYFDVECKNFNSPTVAIDEQRKFAYRIFNQDLLNYLSEGLVKVDETLQQNYIEGDWEFMTRTGASGIRLMK